MLTPVEEKILKKLSEVHIITKSELKQYLKSNGFENVEYENLRSIIDSVTKNLIDKKLIMKINPIGTTSFVITKDGNVLAQNLK